MLVAAPPTRSLHGHRSSRTPVMRLEAQHCSSTSDHVHTLTPLLRLSPPGTDAGDDHPAVQRCGQGAAERRGGGCGCGGRARPAGTCAAGRQGPHVIPNYQIVAHFACERLPAACSTTCCRKTRPPSADVSFTARQMTIRDMLKPNLQPPGSRMLHCRGLTEQTGGSTCRLHRLTLF